MIKKFFFTVLEVFTVYVIITIFPHIINYTKNELPASENLKITGFTLTAYCPNACCNGKWAGKTSSGKDMEYYKKNNINIIAVDPKIIPLGTKIRYNNKEYLAADVGTLIKGKKIDVLVPNHKSTIKFGKRYNQTITILKKN